MREIYYFGKTIGLLGLNERFIRLFNLFLQQEECVNVMLDLLHSNGDIDRDEKDVCLCGRKV